MITPVEILNRRMGESLGLVCGGTLPRFCWKWAPDQPWFVYDTDDRTLVRKSWADAPAPDGGRLGKVWVLAEWRQNKAFDHCGFGDGLRIPVTHDFRYSPYLETALPRGQEPDAELTQNYIAVIDFQLQRSAEFDPDSEHNLMAEEKYTSDANERKNKAAWREFAAAGYDDWTGAFGNCEPGARSGFLSFQNVES